MSNSILDAMHNDVLYYEQLSPAANYYEELGSVLWWHLPICEPSAIARFVDEIDGRFDGGYPDGWHTHFSRMPVVWNDVGQARHPIAKEEIHEQ